MLPVTQLKVDDLQVGTGAEAVDGKKVSVQSTGWLVDGTKFDSSYDRNEPFAFTLGGGQVIKGWDQGVKGMKVGGKRRLTIPADLAYGSQGAGKLLLGRHWCSTSNYKPWSRRGAPVFELFSQLPTGYNLTCSSSRLLQGGLCPPLGEQLACVGALAAALRRCGEFGSVTPSGVRCRAPKARHLTRALWQ